MTEDDQKKSDAEKEEEIGAELNERQKRFVDEYLIDLNATQAAIRAGYSENGAAVHASRMLINPNILEYLNLRREQVSERLGITQDWVLQNLKKVVAKGLQEEQILNYKGEPTGEFKFDSSGANRALELLGKHLGMFTNKTEINARVKSDVKANVNLSGDATFTIKIPNSTKSNDDPGTDSDS